MIKEKIKQFDAVNMNFASVIQSPKYKLARNKTKVSINIESRDILFDNENTQEIVYLFIKAEHNCEEKLLKLELSFIFIFLHT